MSFLSHVRQLVARLSALTMVHRRRPERPPAKPVRRAQQFRPRLNGLENRTLPSAVTWINPAGGNWFDASNWSTGAVPGPTDHIAIRMPVTVVSTGIVTIGARLHLSKGAVLDFAGGTNYLADGADVTGGGLLEVSGGGTYVRGLATVRNIEVTRTGALVLSRLTTDAGVLVVTSHYIQTSTGSLVADIRNVNDYGQMLVQGEADLDGNLNIYAYPTYHPTEGDFFQVLTANTLNGTFANVHGTDLGNGLQFVPVYGDQEVDLVVAAGPAMSRSTQADPAAQVSGWLTQATPASTGAAALAEAAAPINQGGAHSIRPLPEQSVDAFLQIFSGNHDTLDPKATFG
jgi:hypothetical protein